jgi:hypothetical protein
LRENGARVAGRNGKYNAPMRRALTLLALFSCAALAQDPPPQPKPDPRKNQKIERIRLEDSGSRIDELRVGGETQSITVTPKAKVPAYQIRPKDGQRVWNVLGF